MNEKLIEMAKAAGFVWNTSYREFSEDGFINEKLEKLEKLIREDERQSRWLPIDDAPADIELLLLYADKRIKIGQYHININHVLASDEWVEQPTHFQRKPEPPREQSCTKG